MKPAFTKSTTPVAFALLRASPPSAGTIPQICLCFIWIQKKGFTVEPPRNDSGANFQRNDSDSGPKKSEIHAESRSYRPKVGDTAQNPNRIAQKRAPNGV